MKRRLLIAALIAVAGTMLTGCGTIRSHWGIESEYGYDTGWGNGHHKKHKKPKPPKHHHHHHDD